MDENTDVNVSIEVTKPSKTEQFKTFVKKSVPVVIGGVVGVALTALYFLTSTDSDEVEGSGPDEDVEITSVRDGEFVTTTIVEKVSE